MVENFYQEHCTTYCVQQTSYNHLVFVLSAEYELERQMVGVNQIIEESREVIRWDEISSWWKLLFL